MYILCYYQANQCLKCAPVMLLLPPVSSLCASIYKPLPTTRKPLVTQSELSDASLTVN